MLIAIELIAKLTFMQTCTADCFQDWEQNNQPTCMCKGLTDWLCRRRHHGYKNRQIWRVPVLITYLSSKNEWNSCYVHSQSFSVTGLSVQLHMRCCSRCCQSHQSAGSSCCTPSHSTLATIVLQDTLHHLLKKGLLMLIVHNT